MSLEVIKNVAIAVLIPMIRPTAGWLVNALKDGKISWPEWRMFISKTVKVMTLNLVAYYGLSFAGLDVNLIATSLGSIIADKVLDAVKENKNVKDRP